MPETTAGRAAAEPGAPRGGKASTADKTATGTPHGGDTGDRQAVPTGAREARVIRVLLAEDMRILSDTLAAVLGMEHDIDVVAAVPDGSAVVAAVARERPDVAVVDIDMPGMDGLTAAARLREAYPQCKVLILTVLANPGNLRRAIAAGVAGFLPKETPASELADAIRTVAAGGRVVSQELAVAALESPGCPLSPREAEVLRRFSAGAGPAEIAAEMFLSYGTVRNYLAAAVTKLGARNRTDAARIAAEQGWL
jgi:two-component system, NarL family, response regulator DesR